MTHFALIHLDPVDPLLYKDKYINPRRWLVSLEILSNESFFLVCLWENTKYDLSYA